VNHISCSIVLYQADYNLLNLVVASVFDSYSKINDDWTFSIDFVTNDGDANNTNLINIIKSYSNRNFTLRILDPQANIGYGAGNNFSIFKNPKSSYHLVLNPDSILDVNCLIECVKFMQSNHTTSLLTPKVLDFNGKVQFLCKRNPSFFDMLIRCINNKSINHLFKRRLFRFTMLDCDYNNSFSGVEYPTGCFMFFRYNDLLKINGFDESFFLHYEDADIGRKITMISQISYVPSAVVTHKWSRDTHRSWKSRIITIKSGLLYIKKWGGLF
jgi:GT2 family glycosyltransferase